MFRSLNQPRPSKQRTNSREPALEALEARLVLSTFRVNSTLDTVAVSVKTGKDAAGHISLRSAIMAANAKPNSDTIILPAGTFDLTLAGAGEDKDATGDLDISGNVTIKGKGSSSTIIDGNNLDRVIEILSGKVSVANLTLQHGEVLGDVGGGILNSGGKLTLSRVQVVHNVALGMDGDNGIGGLLIPGERKRVGKLEQMQAAAGFSTRPVRSQFRGARSRSMRRSGETAETAATEVPSRAPRRTGQDRPANDREFRRKWHHGGERLWRRDLQCSRREHRHYRHDDWFQRRHRRCGSAGGAGGVSRGGNGGDSNATTSPGHGGRAVGGDGGAGERGGNGFGGGMYNLGVVTTSGTASIFSSNLAFSGPGGTGARGATASVAGAAQAR